MRIFYVFSKVLVTIFFANRIFFSRFIPCLICPKLTIFLVNYLAPVSQTSAGKPQTLPKTWQVAWIISRKNTSMQLKWQFISIIEIWL